MPNRAGQVVIDAEPPHPRREEKVLEDPRPLGDGGVEEDEDLGLRDRRDTLRVEHFRKSGRKARPVLLGHVLSGDDPRLLSESTQDETERGQGTERIPVRVHVGSGNERPRLTDGANDLLEDLRGGAIPHRFPEALERAIPWRVCGHADRGK